MRPLFYVKNNNLIHQKQKYLEVSFQGTIIYEVVRIIGGKILFFEDHLNRFLNSLQKAHLDNPFTNDTIFKHIKDLIKKNNLEYGNVKFLFNKDLQGNIAFYAFEIPHYYPNDSEYDEGVKLILFEAERANPSIKQLHSNLKESVDAAIIKKEAFEAILVHPTGYLTEGSKSNFFIIKNNTVYTSPEKDVLPGVTRKKLIELFNKNKIAYIETRISAKELHTFEAAFISGTSPKVIPAKTIDSNIFDPKNPLLVKIINLYNSEIEIYLENAAKIL